MTLESITPNLMVQNVNQTIAFYTELLGFTLIDTNPESGEFEWAYVMHNKVGLMFQQESSLKAEYPELNDVHGNSALTLYIRVQNIQELYSTLQNKVNVVKPMNTTFYGTEEFAIMDINGFILTFSETPDK